MQHFQSQLKQFSIYQIQTIFFFLSNSCVFHLRASGQGSPFGAEEKCFLGYPPSKVLIFPVKKKNALGEQMSPFFFFLPPTFLSHCNHFVQTILNMSGSHVKGTKQQPSPFSNIFLHFCCLQSICWFGREFNSLCYRYLLSSSLGHVMHSPSMLKLGFIEIGKKKQKTKHCCNIIFLLELLGQMRVE